MPQPRPLHERVPAAQAIRWMNVKRRSRFKRRVPWLKLLAQVDAPYEPRGAARFAAWTRKKIGAKSQPRPTQGVFDVQLKGRALFFTVGQNEELRTRAIGRAHVRPNSKFVGSKEEARLQVLEELGVDALHAVAKPPILGRGRRAFLAEGALAWDKTLARQAARKATHGFRSASTLGETQVTKFVSAALKAYETALLERARVERVQAERAVRRDVRPEVHGAKVSGGERADARTSNAPAKGGNGRQAPNPLKRKKRNEAAKTAVPLSRRRPLALAARHFYKPYEEALEAMRNHRPRLVQQVVDRHSALNALIQQVLDRTLPGAAATDVNLRRRYAWAVVRLFWNVPRASRNMHVPLDFFIDKTGGRHLPGNHAPTIVNELVRENVIVDHKTGQNHSYELNHDHPVVRAVQG